MLSPMIFLDPPRRHLRPRTFAIPVRHLPSYHRLSEVGRSDCTVPGGLPLPLPYAFERGLCPPRRTLLFGTCQARVTQLSQGTQCSLIGDRPLLAHLP